MTTYKLVMPGDMNHYGFLFGGKMLMWVDEVAWIAVSEDYPTLHFVTVAMSEVRFKKSVHPQSVLRFDTRRQKEGHTSVTYHVDVHRRHIESREEEIVFSTDITFVCVGKDGEKRPINLTPREETAAEVEMVEQPVAAKGKSLLGKIVSRLSWKRIVVTATVLTLWTKVVTICAT